MHRKCRTVSDTVFQEFVDLLEETQGELLRIICSAISPVVHSLFKGVITEMMASRIERISEEEILRYQKGSPHLLVHFVN